jgi:malonyl CoA-acyl carrier protein transacylase
MITLKSIQNKKKEKSSISIANMAVPLFSMLIKYLQKWIRNIFRKISLNNKEGNIIQRRRKRLQRCKKCRLLLLLKIRREKSSKLVNGSPN